MPSASADAEQENWLDLESGLFGPRLWSTILAAESARCRRYARIATVVMVEPAGLVPQEATGQADLPALAVLRIGAILKSGSRDSDFVARTHSQRFAVLLPETDEIAAINYIERVRASCDKVLDAAAADAHCAFGWAQSSRTRSVSAAAGYALTRLRSERQRLIIRRRR